MATEIPLRRRGGVLVAVALVDDEDAERLNEYQWRQTASGYAVRGGKRMIYMHRVVMRREVNDGFEVDHMNGDRLDNRKENLRVVTPGQNRQNLNGRGGSSRFRGVCWDKRRQKWKSYVKVNYRLVNLGHSDSEEEAARVAAAYRREHLPFSVG